MKLNFLGFLLIFALFCNGEKVFDTSGPQLMIWKQIFNDVKKIDLKTNVLVIYTICNVGNGTAFDISLKDNSFHEDIFKKIGGEFEARFKKISGRKNLTHVVVLIPKKIGYYKIGAAETYYKDSEDDLVTRQSTSTEPMIWVQSSKHEQKLPNYFYDWLTFSAVTFPSLAIPFAFWYRSKKKYDKTFKTSKKIR